MSAATRKRRKRNHFVGDWRIVWMELWDPDFLDLEQTAYIAFGSRSAGGFAFGTVEGSIDYRIAQRDGQPALEFSWEGSAEIDPVCGRGWAGIVERRLEGRLFFHRGDDSAFTARRLPTRAPRSVGSRRGV